MILFSLQVILWLRLEVTNYFSMNNLNVNGLHYHNSLKTSGPGFNVYKPNTEIISEPLTDKYSVGEQIGR